MGVKRVEYGFLECKKTTVKSWEPKFINDHVKIVKGMIASMLVDGGSIRVSVMCLGRWRSAPLKNVGLTYKCRVCYDCYDLAMP